MKRWLYFIGALCSVALLVFGFSAVRGPDEPTNRELGRMILLAWVSLADLIMAAKA